MAPDLDIEPELLDHALALSGLPVTLALREFIARRGQARIVEAFGTLDRDEGYDHKADRSSRDVVRPDE